MTDLYDTDTIVIGAGVVGLAIAAALAEAGREVVIVEKNARIGEETSARNSEVIHAGLYYAPGSLKGRFCVEGRDRLYDWCAARGVGARNCGKLIVATEPAEEAALQGIVERAAGNGVRGLEWRSGVEAMAAQPGLRAHAALWSPKTGIVDSHGLMVSLLGAAEDHGASLALGAPVERGEVTAEGLVLDIGGTEPVRMRARTVVNAAGLWAQATAAKIEGLEPEHVPPTVLYKGNYYATTQRPPFTTLIYPAPVPGGLGVHVTLDLNGQARFGPDVEPLETDDPGAIDYTVDPARADAFYASVRRYWPDLADGALVPDYAGVRPKIHSDYATDFRIDGPETHGVRGLVNLYGFESPALTGSLAIGAHIAAHVTSMG
ncbi:MAG: NAD(P)/FAD-dependent oxidoreductase [Pseudomonadota bacterium]